MSTSHTLAIDTLKKGGVLAHATETCYGLAVDIFNKEAVLKLYALKKMPLDKPVSILVKDLEQAQQYGNFSPRALELAKKYWPGPLTIIVPRTAALPEWINPGEETVGFRVSSHEEVQTLLEAFDGPLSTTSANVTGQPQAYAVEEFLAQGLQPDFVLNSGRIAPEPPSTIVKVTGEELNLVRQGSVLI